VLPSREKPDDPAALPPLWGVHKPQPYELAAMKTVQF